MAVMRIVCNIATDRIDDVGAFYSDILGLRLVMDLGWIRTYAADAPVQSHISIATQGGSGTPVPDVSIEVDDCDAMYRRVQAVRLPVEYGPVDEPWGVRRFYVRDPSGRLLNILQHI